MGADIARTQPLKRGWGLRVLAWAMYDFAITVFAMNVTSRYFGLWLTETLGGADWMYSVAFALSTGLAALLMPAVGKRSDRHGRRVPWLRAMTLVCVAGTAAIGWSSTALWALVAFGVANIGCQMGGLFYDTLLPTVADGKRVGVVSGLGVAMGYVGAAVGLCSARLIVARHGYGAAFIPSALLIGLAALPSLYSIHESPQPIATTDARTLLHTVRDLLTGPRRQPGLLRFFVGCFIGLNAINTIILFMAVYAKRTAGLTDTQIDGLLLFSTTFAMLGALASGWATDRVGPRRCLLGILLMWCGAITFAVLIPSARWFWLTGPLVGVCLGGTWTSARALAVSLSPPAHVGLLFGVYGFVGRASSNVGPLLWGAITRERARLGAATDRLALASMLILFLISVALLWRLPEHNDGRRIPRYASA